MLLKQCENCTVYLRGSWDQYLPLTGSTALIPVQCIRLIQATVEPSWEQDKDVCFLPTAEVEIKQVPARETNPFFVLLGQSGNKDVCFSECQQRSSPQAPSLRGTTNGGTQRERESDV